MSNIAILIHELYVPFFLKKNRMRVMPSIHQGMVDTGAVAATLTDVDTMTVVVMVILSNYFCLATVMYLKI